MKWTRLSTIGLPLVDGVDRVDGVDAVDTSQATWSTQSTQSTQSTRGAGHLAVALVLLLALTAASACSLVVGNRMECDPDDDRCPPGSRTISITSPMATRTASRPMQLLKQM